jgi:hypothetical protein
MTVKVKVERLKGLFQDAGFGTVLKCGTVLTNSSSVEIPFRSVGRLKRDALDNRTSVR